MNTYCSTGATVAGVHSARQHALHWFQPGGEMAQEWRLVAEFQSLNAITILPHFQNHFDHVIYMALRVHPPRNGKPDEVHPGRSPEHECADLDRTNSTLQV